MAKSKERLYARQLRKQGKSIKEIAKKLNVSISSASYWCRDIILTSEQIKNLQKRVTDPFYGEKLRYLNKKKEEFEKKVQKLKQEGIKRVGKLTKREIFLIGVALYWGEGFKKDHQVGLATSDINIARFYIMWLNKCFDINQENLIVRVTANSSYINKIKALERYWSKELNIPINNFSKPFFQYTRWKKIYENKNSYHGVLRVKVRKSMDLLRKIHGHIEGLSLNTT